MDATAWSPCAWVAAWARPVSSKICGKEEATTDFADAHGSELMPREQSEFTRLTAIEGIASKLVPKGRTQDSPAWSAFFWRGTLGRRYFFRPSPVGAAQGISPGKATADFTDEHGCRNCHYERPFLAR